MFHNQAIVYAMTNDFSIQFRLHLSVPEQNGLVNKVEQHSKYMAMLAYDS